MNRWMKTLLTMALVAAAMVTSSAAVSADDGVDRAYADAMWYFVPELADYANELDHLLRAVEVKPELGSDLVALAHRGEYMVYDLEGTEAPEALRDAHERLLAGLRQLNEAAQIGAEDPAGARYLYDTYEPLLDGARHQIRSWMMARLSIGAAVESPALVVGQ